ncbi:hypothetical protein PX52LOC_05556 [Limnoglobus roseus]|uniref:Uncharacterized protein n=1 Tax=Limnoglobus roseus TaxID=2598579 RepID=A0A5C1AGH7_9BACT|nr:hypothetical protein PX52LOC_05556 [Limnoglobus roseus]
MLQGMTARELLQWEALWNHSPWGPIAADWRLGILMSSWNGQAPDQNRPKWGREAGHRVVQLTFDQACQAFSRTR